MENQYKYTVCIHCMTYNHENYLADALEGFVMQKTTFPFVAVVIDDFSTDGTADVLRKYEAKYPDIIKAVYLTENYYSQRKSKKPFLEPYDSQSKYIALCEGDDYWTDPYKLQKQVDILENDETLMACCTNCSVVDMQGKILEEKRKGMVVKDNQQGRYNLRDFFNQGHQYPTLSVVYRNIYADEVRKKCEIMRNPYLGDWTLWIALLCFGDMYYLDEVTCAYRINLNSVTHTIWVKNKVNKIKSSFDLLPRVASVMPENYEDIVANLRNTNHLWAYLAKAYYQEKQYFRMLYALCVSMVKCPKIIWKKIYG